MTYAAIEKKLALVPIEYLNEVSAYLDEVISRKKEENSSKSKFFALAGNIDIDGEAVEKLREESML